MQIIRTWADLAHYVNGPIDPDIKCLLLTRRDQLMEFGDLTDLGTFALVQPGDRLCDIEAELGFSIVIDAVPAWEWIERHGAIWEAPVILSDDGFGNVLIVPDVEGIDPRLLALCREHA